VLHTACYFISSPYIYIDCLYLHFSVAYLCLHSFPTRRSSDLLFSTPTRPRERFPSMFAPSAPILPLAACLSGCAAALELLTCMRSEEHMSELQSRGHLVCRLLLEKKKCTTY